MYRKSSAELDAAVIRDSSYNSRQINQVLETMSGQSDKSTDREELLIRLLDGDCSEEELASLNKSLRESSELRSEVSRFLLDESLICDLSSTRKEADDIFQRLSTSSSLGEPSKQFPTPGQLFRRMWNFVDSHGVAVAAIAATLLAGFFLYNSMLQSRMARLQDLAYSPQFVDPRSDDSKDITQDQDGVDETRKAESIGHVAGLMDPEWPEGATPLSFGDQITSGQRLQIQSGIVELLLTNGAKVTIEGPAEYEASTALQSTVLEGKIAAAAPRVARGLTILTPTAELIDIGTQFGVVVEESGESELHVFEGDVVARSRFADKGSAMVHAGKDQAMRFNSFSHEPERIQARNGDFVRYIPPKQSLDSLPALPSTTRLALWYAADMCSGFADGERVNCWQDLLIGDNDFADNAWQFDETRRPTFIHDGEGRPALRFDGWASYLETSPMSAAEQQTIFVICAPAPMNYANDYQGQIVFKYGMEPTLELAVMPNLEARSWVWTGNITPQVGVLRSKPVTAGKPMVMTYSYDVSANNARLWVNRESQGVAEASVSISQSSQRFIGNHYELFHHAAFFGNLYEIVVFDRILDEQQLAKFWDYFSQRYAID